MSQPIKDDFDEQYTVCFCQLFSPLQLMAWPSVETSQPRTFRTIERQTKFCLSPAKMPKFRYALFVTALAAALVIGTACFARVVSADNGMVVNEQNLKGTTLQMADGVRNLLEHFHEQHESFETGSASHRELGSVLQLPMYYLEELMAHLERFIASGALQVPFQQTQEIPPAASSPQAADVSPSVAEKKRTRGGNSEVRVFMNVPPLTMLQKICHGYRSICTAEFEDSLFQAISASANDPSFTKDRLKLAGISARNAGVEQIVIITDDGNLRLAELAKQAILDIAKCRTDPSLPICQTATGNHLSFHEIIPKVTSIRAVR
ncbi:hypothetical protein TGME49_231390 [Toxoplasma gondii ME49]|uniref:Transmembrane protein n=3 Tax=Toxoplasma gondii TaxID=5811 RepID=A0A125YS00_TOXGV|nr:hypothetical protein TGME49_231390 [Toxoplasma gondii ME49]EPT28943.1 hypothetical protein TGME49_231390 [Toxoplasma gondii ME49]ESS35729.1 putative transmembrane protein [Toxoplasma gondii VEG]|eukprot:XP_002368030.2 hypothetical protein TGME49_231390 [Toxoplasma gondii ME49]